MSVDEINQANDADLKAETNLAPGQRLRLAGPRERNWWTVQAVSEHFAVCVRTAAFQPTGTLEYTVLDWRSAVRGSCNLLGYGYGDGSYSAAECDRMLTELEFDPLTDPARVAATAEGKKSWVPTQPHLEVSYRTRVQLHIRGVENVSTWNAVTALTKLFRAPDGGESARA